MQPTEKMKKFCQIFYEPGSLGIESIGAPRDRSRRPAQRIGRLLKKAYISSLVVSTAGMTWLVHNRMADDRYTDVNLGQAIVEVSIHAASKVTGLPPTFHAEMTRQATLRRKNQVIESLDGSLTPIQWFNHHKIRSPAVSEILSASGIEHDGRKYVRVGWPEASAPSAADLQMLLTEVAAMSGWDLHVAAEVVDAGYHGNQIARSLCDQGVPDHCISDRILIGAEARSGAISFDMRSGELSAVMPDEARSDDPLDLDERPAPGSPGLRS